MENMTTQEIEPDKKTREILGNIIKNTKNNVPMFLCDSLDITPFSQYYFGKYKSFHQDGKPILKDDLFIDRLKNELRIPDRPNSTKILYDSRKLIRWLPFREKAFPIALTDDQTHQVYITKTNIPDTKLCWVEFRIDQVFAGLARIVTTPR